MTCTLRHWWFVCLFAVLSLGTEIGNGEELAANAGKESLPPNSQVTRIEAMPASLELTDKYDHRQLLLTAHLASGDRVDVTRMATLLGESKLLDFSATRLARPKAEGAETLSFEVGGQSIAVPVKVSGLAQERPISYIRDVAPTMSKLGCNSGTCHGGQQGKNGFQLSLRGYDPIFDHRALTDDLASRRFNRAAPDQSLMLLKPAGAVPHVGGTLMHQGEPNYEVLRKWIADGAKLDLESPRVKSIEVFPKEPTIPLPGMRQQMLVYATYSDGTRRDVTSEAFIETSLSEIVETDKTGIATAVRRGEAAILARYEGAYAATPVVVMGDRTGFEWQETPENNKIDTLVYNKLKKVRVLPSGLCTDAEFVRRVHLDLVGLPPTAAEVMAFLGDPRDSKVKRDELVDQLVGSSAYVEHWTNKWADLLQVNRKFLGEQGVWTFRNWIKQAVASNMPYDKFVYEILSASGSTQQNPPASYYKVLREPGETMENTTQLFLAVRFNCNKCHDHPFERWTQDQYYHMAAYFAQVGRKVSPEAEGKTVGGTNVEKPLPLVEIIYDQKEGEVKHERTGEVTPPSFPYQPREEDAEASRREQLAKWVTAKDNIYFAKSYVNRVWSYLLGVGIIEPIDDIRAGNPPTNPELLDYLTNEFVRSNFDVQHMMRLICKSRAYQHSIQTSRWNEDDQINYSHALARRLPAETLFDSVYQVTGAKLDLPGVPPGFRASQLPDSSSELSDGFLALFGRPPRESACECERSTGVMLGQTLNLVNGPTLAKAIADPDNRISKLVAEEPNDANLIQSLFLTILSRPPSESELVAGLKAIASAAAAQKERAEAFKHYETDVFPRRLEEWEKEMTESSWRPLEWTELTTSEGAALTKQEDGSILVSGVSPLKDTYTLVAKSNGAISAIRIETIPDASLPAKGAGRASNGNFVVNDFRMTTQPPNGLLVNVPFKSATADFSQSSYDAAGMIDESDDTGWAVAPKLAEGHKALLQLTEPLGGERTLTLTIDQFFGQQHTLGRFRIMVTGAKKPSLAEPPANIAAIFATAADKRTPEQKKELSDYFKTQDAEWMRRAKENESPTPARLLGAQDLAWALLNSPSFLFNR